MSSRNVRRHTKPCVYFQKNQCPLSAAACDYAHVLVPSDELESLKLPQATLRTKPCRFFLGGQCKDGYWCRFKHPVNVQSHQASASESDNAQGSDDYSASEGESSDDVRDLDPDWKAKPEQHPRYRTRPCRNFLLGKCAYGDHCSYMHVSPSHSLASTSGYPSPSPSLSHSHAVPTSGMPSSSTYPLGLPRNVSMPHPGAISLSRMSSSSSQGPDEPAAPMNDAFSVMTLATGLPAYPPVYPSVAHSAPGQHHHAHSSPPSTTPPYTIYPHPHHGHSQTMPMAVGIVHVPVVAVPMYQQQLPRQHDDYRDAQAAAHSSRTRSSSSSQHPNAMDRAKTSPSRNVLFKTKLCKFYTETGACQKGDNCNYIHDKSGMSVSSSPMRERPERRRSSTASGSSNEGGADSKKNQAGEEDRSGGYHKINWRVLGGGVLIGGDSNRRHHDEATPRADASSSHRTQTQQVHPLSGTLVPSKSPSPLTLDAQIEQASSSSGSSPIHHDPQRSSRRTAAAKPAALKIASPQAVNKSSPTSSGSKYQASESLDWSDDYDEIIVSTNDSGFPSGMSKASKVAQAVPIWQTRSSPSSPLHAHTGVSSLFPAESP